MHIALVTVRLVNFKKESIDRLHTVVDMLVCHINFVK